MDMTKALATVDEQRARKFSRINKQLHTLCERAARQPRADRQAVIYTRVSTLVKRRRPC